MKRILCLVLFLWLSFGSVVMVSADLQPFIPEPKVYYERGYVVLDIHDAMSHAAIPDATVYMYDDDWIFIDICIRTDDHMLVTGNSVYMGDTYYFLVWHENYYIETFKYEVPFVETEKTYFIFYMELYRKCANVEVNITSGKEFPMEVPYNVEIDLAISVDLKSEDSAFGMENHWFDPRTGKDYSSGMVVIGSNNTLGGISNDYSYAWYTLYACYYAFEFKRIWNDADAEDDGKFSLAVSMEFWGDCEIGIWAVDTIPYDQSSILNFPYSLITTLSYANETLDYVGNIDLMYGFQPAHIFPYEYISLDDLYIDIYIDDDSYWGDDDWIGFNWEIPPEVARFLLLMSIPIVMCIIVCWLFIRDEMMVKGDKVQWLLL